MGQRLGSRARRLGRHRRNDCCTRHGLRSRGASLLGVAQQGTPYAAPARVTGLRALWHWLINKVLTQNNLLGAGVLSYMAAGAALGVTYLANQNESPGIVKTIAVAFGGYVIAYIGTAYKNRSEEHTSELQSLRH